MYTPKTLHSSMHGGVEKLYWGRRKIMCVILFSCMYTLRFASMCYTVLDSYSDPGFISHRQWFPVHFHRSSQHMSWCWARAVVAWRGWPHTMTELQLMRQRGRALRWVGNSRMTCTSIVVHTLYALLSILPDLHRSSVTRDYSNLHRSVLIAPNSEF